MTTDTVGGVWIYSLDLCQALEKYDVEVHLVAMGGWPSRQQQKQVSTMENVILYKSDFKLEWMQDPWEDVKRAQKWINCIYHTVNPDLVHFNNYAQTENDWSCPTLTVFHSCVQTWWQAVKGTSVPSQWDKYTKAVKYSLNASDIVVGPTRAILEKAMKAHDITSETKVIYNGRDMASSTVQEKEDFILCIGRIWDEAKNLKLLSQIADKLPWPVYIAGSDHDPATEKTIKIENVHFLGKLGPGEVRHWMDRAGIFVSPTKYEPFGLAILEAAKFGCALVLSELDTLKELWEDSASFFDPKNPGQAVERINSLIEHEKLRTQFSTKAKERSEQYTSDQMGSEYYKLYREAAEKKLNKKLVSV